VRFINYATFADNRRKLGDPVPDRADFGCTFDYPGADIAGLMRDFLRRVLAPS